MNTCTVDEETFRLLDQRECDLARRLSRASCLRRLWREIITAISVSAKKPLHSASTTTRRSSISIRAEYPDGAGRESSKRCLRDHRRAGLRLR